MRASSAALLLVLAGCDLNLFGPDLEYVNRRPMEPVPVEYAALYAETATCLGLADRFEDVRWYVADSVIVNGRHRGGVLEFPNDITMWRKVVGMDWAIRHEMAHHITGIGDALHDDRGQVPCS